MKIVEKSIRLVIGALAWLSILGLIWGILLGWFPETVTWVHELFAVIMFVVVGILAIEPGSKETDGG